MGESRRTKVLCPVGSRCEGEFVFFGKYLIRMESEELGVYGKVFTLAECVPEELLGSLLYLI